jgi:hypothetical protein
MNNAMGNRAEPLSGLEEILDSGELGNQAAALWLILSIDKKLDPEKFYRIDDLFGLSEDKLKNEDEETVEEWEAIKARFAKTLDAFFEGIEELDAEERYDAIVDGIDKAAEDADISFLWGLVRAVSRDEDYAGNKRRVLRHLCRKLGLENSVLPALENAAKTLSSVKKEREELTASDRPYREVAAALAGLDRKEQETLDSLGELGVDMTELSGDDEGGVVSCGEDNIVDKLGDAVVEVIRGVTNGVEGILDGFTSAFSRLM